MRLFSPSLEQTIVKSICSNTRSASFLLPCLNADSFYYEPAKQAYDRISRVLVQDGTVPGWTELLNDTILDEAVRKQLRRCKSKVITSKERCTRVAAKLDAYRQLRLVVLAAESTLREAEKGSADPKQLLDRLSDELVRARSLTNQDDILTHIGQGRKSLELAKRVLKNESNNYIPTGLHAFDGRNRGISRGSLWILAATTGGGKSAMALQVARNAAEAGHRVCIVSLEMSDEELMQRRLSSINGISMEKMVNPSRMSRKEKSRAFRRFRQYHRDIKRKGGLESYMVPQGDADIKEILYTLRPFKYDMIVIDYVGLLGGMDGDDQWRQLGNATRFGKRYGASNDTAICMCAQLSEDLIIRYSRAMKEHANNMWAWKYDGADGAGPVEIGQQKARNQSAFPFSVYFDMEHMTIRDLTEEEADGAEIAEEPKQVRGKKGARQGRNSEHLDRGARNKKLKRPASEYATI